MRISAKMPAVAAVLTAGLAMVRLARVAPEAAPEETISGTITATRIINQNARLTGDVTCTVTGVSCIQFGAAGITLNLSGFTVTGLADAVTGCPDGPVVTEFGIDTAGRPDVIVQGPGVVQQFRGQGVVVNGSARAKVVSVTASTNCGSGIFLPAATDSLIEDNLLVKNGRVAAACGGI
jgi:hypothetical protein